MISHYCCVALSSQALREVEAERLEVRQTLMQELGINMLPKNMCNIDLRPAVAPRIQSACQDFPYRACGILNKNGLDLYDFETLLDRTKYDLIYRARVNALIRKIDKKMS